MITKSKTNASDEINQKRRLLVEFGESGESHPYSFEWCTVKNLVTLVITNQSKAKFAQKNYCDWIISN